MNAVAIAKRITGFFADKRNKGTGNTKTIIDGAKATGANVVVASLEEAAKAYRGIKPGKVINLDEVQAGALDRPNKDGWPLVLDNGALVALLNGLLIELENTKTTKKAKTTAPKSKDV